MNHNFIFESHFVEKGKVFCHPDDAKDIKAAMKIYMIITNDEILSGLFVNLLPDDNDINEEG